MTPMHEQTGNNNDTLKVLLVDDEKTSTELTKLNLESTDPSIEITIKNSPYEALEQASHKQFDCIVSDYQMPGMNGIQLNIEIKKTHTTPFIIYTSHGSEDVASAAYASGVDDYVKKEASLAHYQILAKRIKHAAEKRRTEQELENSNQRLREILDSIQETFWQVDRDWNFVYVSKNFADAAKLKQDGIIGQSIWKLFPNHLGTPFEKNLRETMEKKEIRRFEINGKYTDAWYAMTISPSSVGISALGTDITSHKRLEEQLASEKKRLLSILESSLDGITVNTGGVLVYVNNAFSTMIGYDKSELIGKHIADMHTTEYRDFVKSITEKRQRNEPAPLRYQVDLLKSDGSRLPVEYSVSLIEFEGKPSSLTFIRDFSEHRRSEEALKFRQAEIRSLFDYMPAGLVLFEATSPYKVLLHNRYYQELFSEPYKSRGMQDLNVYEYAPEVEASGIVAAFEEVIRTREPVRYLDFPYNSNPARKSWFNWYLVPIIIGGRVVSFVSLSIDVTDKHLTDEELKKMQTSLTKSEKELVTSKELVLTVQRQAEFERLATIDNLSAMVAHDIRSPLNSASQALQMARENPEMATNLTALAEKSVSRAIQMIGELRENTRILTPHKQWFNLRLLLEDIIKEKSLSESVVFELVCGDGFDRVMIDPLLLRRVIENLLSNAVEAMSDGGKVKIEVWRNDELFISVSDVGMGISRESAEKIFDPLFTTKSNGLGLGLFFCKRAMDAVGGKISFVSRVGEGTTFVLTLSGS
jgi:PAS domain S-box-containing protein